MPVCSKNDNFAGYLMEWLKLPTFINKRKRTPKGQLRMDNSEKLATLSTQDTGQRQTKPHHYTQMLSFDNSVLKMYLLNTQINFHMDSFNYFLLFICFIRRFVGSI